MNRLTWLKKITELHPEQAEGWYWLGKEYLEHNEIVPAVLALTEGMKIAEDQQRSVFLQEIANASKAPVSTVQIDQPSVMIDSTATQSQTRKNFGLQVISGGKSESIVESKTLTFDDVAGLDELKKTIQMKIISPFFNQGLFAKFRKKAGGGVLLYGPPGCGKTFMAKATAGECKAKFVSIHITDILDPYIGVSERNLKDIFDKARYQKPSILFMDEIDAIGFNRAKSSANLRGLVDTFLTEMDGMDTTTDQVLVIGATNMPWDVDNALKRPGRFDRLIFIAPPDEEARKMIFKLKLSDRFAENINYEWLAKSSEFFSGADIEQVCERAVEFVLEEILDTNHERPIQMKDLEKALTTINASTLEWLRTAKNYVRYSNQSGLYNDIENYLKVYGKRI
jgi:SpoVK/Ycf46/Vps4 family AAA+-type ATPase